MTPAAHLCPLCSPLRAAGPHLHQQQSSRLGGCDLVLLVLSRLGSRRSWREDNEPFEGTLAQKAVSTFRAPASAATSQKEKQLGDSLR